MKKIWALLKNFRKKQPQKNEVDVHSYLPSFWEDDYCQIEIVPLENMEFILKTIEQISDLMLSSKAEFGFTEIFRRQQMPVKTFSKEIKTHYLKNLFTSFEFEEAKNINYGSNNILDCKTGQTQAYGFSNFTIFFDTEYDLVKNMWLSVSLIVSVKRYDLIKSALYAMGKEFEMVLVDWNSLELFELADPTQIDKYLVDYWK